MPWLPDAGLQLFRDTMTWLWIPTWSGTDISWPRWGSAGADPLDVASNLWYLKPLRWCCGTQLSPITYGLQPVTWSLRLRRLLQCISSLDWYDNGPLITGHMGYGTPLSHENTFAFMMLPLLWRFGLQMFHIIVAGCIEAHPAISDVAQLRLCLAWAS